MSDKLSHIWPSRRCRLRKLKLDQVRNWLEMESVFVQNLAEASGEEMNKQADKQRQQLDEIRGMPLSFATLDELINENNGIISQPTVTTMYVSIASFVDREKIRPGCKVLTHNTSSTIVGVVEDDDDPLVNVMKVDNKSLQETFADIGGLEDQIQEIKEAVELPLTHPELYETIGVSPPKGVILYGPPGTGKTLLAKAVANTTQATFFRVTGSELVQKYLGEGPKLTREIFRAAKQHAPSIIFLDEIDAIGYKRYEARSSGEKEVQRTMLELLEQLDGFDNRGDVKVIMATNRVESLDPALIRPGRIDRKIECPLPDLKTKRNIFKIHTRDMTLDQNVNVNNFISSKDDLSGADIKAICTEAGLLALRERRMKVNVDDFQKAKENVVFRKKENEPTGLYL